MSSGVFSVLLRPSDASWPSVLPGAAHNDARLLSAIKAGAPGRCTSSPMGHRHQETPTFPPFPSIINAVILTSATSSGNAFCYTGSRYLFGFAQIGQAPRLLLRCSKNGVPYWCVLAIWSFGLLTFMSVSAGSSLVFAWFQNLVTIAQLFTWCSICVAYIYFKKALDAQGVDRNTLVFKSPMQPFLAWGCLDLLRPHHPLQRLRCGKLP